MIPFNIITGFLGSGKTTLLKNLLSSGGSERIAIIQNEFAASGIDGKELQELSTNFKLLEINNGSVFCVCQLSNFLTVLQKLVKDYEPDLIYLESSGMADPITVAELLQGEEVSGLVALNKIITIVDAVNYFRGIKMLERVKHQIMVADLVLLNKTDLNSDQLEAIESNIQELNPFTSIERTIHCKCENDVFGNNRAEGERPLFDIKAEGAPKELSACVLKTHVQLSETQLNIFLDTLQARCPRVKGFVNLSDGSCVSVHTVFDQREIVPFVAHQGPTELIAFGQQLSPKDLKMQFDRASGEGFNIVGKWSV